MVLFCLPSTKTSVVSPVLSIHFSALRTRQDTEMSLRYFYILFSISRVGLPFPSLIYSFFEAVIIVFILPARIYGYSHKQSRTLSWPSGSLQLGGGPRQTETLQCRVASAAV